MKSMVMQVRCSLILSLAFVLPSTGAQVTDDINKSSREFVERFYQWYVPSLLHRGRFRSWNIALRYKRSAFSPQLIELLTANSDAQAACRDLVGLDFDPFLTYQDVAERYVVGKIAQKGQAYEADIHAVRSGEQGEKPDVTAEFVEKDGQWFFVNFHYPDGDDLVTILKSPRPPCSRPRRPNLR